MFAFLQMKFFLTGGGGSFLKRKNSRSRGTNSLLLEEDSFCEEEEKLKHFDRMVSSESFSFILRPLCTKAYE